MEGEFIDIPLTQEARIQCFRYRGRKYSRITCEELDLPIVAVKTGETQLYRLLGLSVRGLDAERNWEIRDRLIREAVKKVPERKTPIYLRCVRGRDAYFLYATVTELFVDIPTQEVVDLTERVFSERRISLFEKIVERLEKKIIVKYYFPNSLFQEGQGHRGLWFQNSRKGTASLTLGEFLFIQVCSNGMMSPASFEILKKVHRGTNGKGAILEEFGGALRTVLDQIFSPLRVEEKPLSWQEFEELEIAKKYKEPIRAELERKMLERPLTILDLSNAISFQARRAPAWTKLQMERMAWELLFSNDKRRR